MIKKQAARELANAITLRELAIDYLYLDKAKFTLAESTLKQRKHHINDVILPKLGPMLIRDVTTSDIVYLLKSVGKIHVTHIAILTIGASVNKLCKTLEGIRGFTPHDLRSTARSHLTELGVNIIVAERCLNHSLGGLVGIYDQHDYMIERRVALELWCNLITSCESGKFRAKTLDRFIQLKSG